MVCLRHTCLSSSSHSAAVQSWQVCAHSRLATAGVDGLLLTLSAIASSDPRSRPWGNPAKCLSICVCVKKKTRLSFRQSRVRVRTCIPSEAKEHFGVLQLKLHLGLASCPDIYFFHEVKRPVSMLSFYWENGYHKMCSSTFKRVKVF